MARKKTEPVTSQVADLRERLAPVVEHAAKILMYLGTREARQRECREKSDALAALGRLRSPAKAQKVSRQAERLMDRIVVGPAAFEARQDVPAGHHASPGTHWRRGHFRMQAYGPHHAERRPAWIAPVLVNGDLLGGAPAKAYSVR